MTSLLVAAAVVALLSLLWLGVRFSSRHDSHPCPAWLAWLVELDNPIAKSYRASVIVERLELRPGMTVLDAGCGPGRVTVPVAQRVGPEGEVVALDMQTAMLARAEEKVRAAGLSNVRFRQAGLGEGMLEINRYDRALLVTVLGEIPDGVGALMEIFGALKPGGLLSVTETVFDPHYQSRDRVTALAAESGFREKSFFGNRISFTLNFEKPDS